MFKLIFVAAMMTLIGCSKDGAKSRLMDGAEAPAVVEPTLVDTNLPGPDGNPAP